MKRRDFLKKTMATAGAITLHDTLAEAAEAPASQTISAGSMPRRSYGKTGEMLSVIGFGGIVVMDAEQNHANRVVAEMVEKGINYFDVAPSYGDAEIKLGPALEPYRKDAFLACKTGERDAKGAAEELERSLKRLRTDHFDLYQLHGISNVEEDVDAAFAKGGAMEVFIKAKKDGKVRYLGFSAHSEEAALAAMERYDFDSVLFPINCACYYKGDFGPRVIKEAQSKGMAILALKTFARQKWTRDHPKQDMYPKCWYEPTDDKEEALLHLKFTLSQPITAAIPPGDESLFRLAMDLIGDFKPIRPDETNKVKKLAMTLDPLFSRIQDEA